MIEQFHEIEPYSLTQEEKQELLLKELLELTEHHKAHCDRYRRIIEAYGYQKEKINSISDFPFLPVRLFKELELKSIPDEDVFKVMTSSGTTGQSVSRVILDKDNAILQQKVLLRLLGDFIGKKRLPMLIIDSPDVVKNRKLFTARGATVMGLDFAARNKVYALNTDMSFNEEAVGDFLKKYGGEKFLVFGFTFMVWQHFFQEMEKIKERKFDFSNGYLLTGGGWKKLETEAVSRNDFKQYGKDTCGIIHYVDHYSMAEQSGCIYAECEYGHLHASIYSDVIPRRYKDFSPCEIGEPGIMQTVSVLPHSYPGHSLLTEDEGMIVGVDDCPCGRKGKYIKILGRIKNAEIRGCSDTYATDFRKS